MTETLKTVLLLALPASGKSEVRRYLDHLTPQQRTDDFRMGPTVQLDDFPYVHMMRRFDDELAKLDKPRIFFASPDQPFKDGREWGTLIALLNEDYDDLINKRVATPSSAALHLFDRLDRAAESVGAPARIAPLDPEVKQAIADAMEAEAAENLAGKHSGYPDSLDGKTLVVEFARGGPDGSDMPLPPPYGYRYSVSQLSEGLLANATILYVWVTPEESRRKNDARTDPNDPGSILHHGVPIDVMMNEYGCDDMDWLVESSTKPGTITIEAHGKAHNIPIGRFDNRVDKTSFLREDPDAWKKEDVEAVHAGLKSAIDTIVGALA